MVLLFVGILGAVAEGAARPLDLRSGSRGGWLTDVVMLHSYVEFLRECCKYS